MEYDEKQGPWVEQEESSPDKEVGAGCRSGSGPGLPPAVVNPFALPLLSLPSLSP